MKLYCKPFFADTILLSVRSYLNSLLNERILLKFFYVRYIDSSFHLRVRLKLSDRTFFSEVVNEIHEILNKEILNDMVSIKLDNYQRELERYGIKDFDDVETLFFYNSITTLNFIEKREDGLLKDSDRWQFGLFYANYILSLFNMNIKEKLEFVKLNDASFSEEFNKNKVLNKQLDKKYRAKENIIKASFFNSNYLTLLHQDLKLPLSPKIKTNIERISNQSSDQNSLFYMLSNVIHMDCNRLFRNEQRKHEYVIYDFLSRFYKKEFYHNLKKNA
ncbi:thiopeptide-type bacteriocin biosynthesis protein [Algibacter lectus]|nr:thiopeptide-type bacteriocin biosynthesis protein [Algibacter lectus]